MKTSRCRCSVVKDPYDRYGRLVMDAFLTLRLVVDPGMNYFGWSLEQAREYMLENTMQSDLETAAETLRYATDMPGQALGYKMGHKRILDLRRETEAALGDAFDIRAFHSVVIGSGAMGMDILSGHVNWYIQTSR